MGKIISRRLELNLRRGKSAFLWGPRRTGKTTWIRNRYPKEVLIDLLKVVRGYYGILEDTLLGFQNS